MMAIDQTESRQYFGSADCAAADTEALGRMFRSQPRRERSITRQVLIAAAIAAGLIALWAALLPLAA